MTPRGTIEGVKENAPLLQLITVLVLVVIVGYQETTGQTRPVADKEVVDTQFAAIQSTLVRIEEKVDQLDPMSRELTALKIRVGALEQAIGRDEP